jgi:ADP-ribose pyrophosphatase YjhB (NUDIX family)
VLLRGDEVLLIRRGRPPEQGAWSLPGGKQELGETAEAAARRELLEETGLTCGPLTLVGNADLIHYDNAGKIEYHYTILNFAARYLGGEASPGDDVTHTAWAKPEDFERYSLWAEILRVIQQAILQLPR